LNCKKFDEKVDLRQCPYKIIAAIIAVLSLSAVAVADASAKSQQKKHHVSKAKKAHKSEHPAKKQHTKKNTKAAKESPKAEAAKPVENSNVGGEMKTRIIQ
jgi:hypothetical protein